jgi:hypothetical protein
LLIGLIGLFGAVPVSAAEDLINPFFYEGLTDDEKTAYDTLKAAVLENTETIAIYPPLSKESMDLVSGVLSFYDPYAFNIRSVEAVTDGVTSYYNITFRYDRDVFTNRLERIAESETEILELVENQSNIYGKLKIIHDEINKNCIYDETAAEKGNIYGALVGKKANSFGYAAAFTYLAGKAGLTSFINIYSRDGVNYARNSVYYGEKWYNIDCASDDDSRFVDKSDYGYFMVSDAAYSGCVPYSYFFTSPACEDDSMSYYKISELETDTPSNARRLIADLIIAAKKEGRNTIRFSLADDTLLQTFTKEVANTSYLTDILEIVAKYTEKTIITYAADFNVNTKTRVVTIVIYSPETALSDYYSNPAIFTADQIMYFKFMGIN